MAPIDSLLKVTNPSHISHKRKCSDEIKRNELVNRFLRNGATMRAIKKGNLELLKVKDIEDLPFYFGSKLNHPHLETFILSNRILSYPLVKVLTEIINSPCLGLKVLALNNVSMDKHSLLYLNNGLKHSTTLEKVQFKQAQFDDRALATILNSLCANKTLKALILERMELDANQTRAFQGCINSPNSGLKALKLSSCSLDLKSFSTIANMVRLNNQLRELDISFNCIGAGGADLLYRSLIFNNYLVSLNLEGNNIEARGCERLASCLEINTTLQHLNLRNTLLGNRGFIALCRALKTNQALLSLNVAQNRITDDACIPLHDALIINSTLQHLNLDYNLIGSRGALSISSMLKSSLGLQELTLIGNPLGDTGLLSILEGLTSNKIIQHIDLSNINFEVPSLLKQALEAIGDQLNLKTLNMSFTFEGWENVYTNLQSILTYNFILYREQVNAALRVLMGTRIFCLSLVKYRDLPLEILEDLAIGFDTKGVLNRSHYTKILKFGSNRSTLKSNWSRLEFLTYVFGTEFREYPQGEYNSLLRSLED